MKKLLTVLGLLVAGQGFAQTFPVNNLQVNGNATVTGTTTANGTLTANGPATFVGQAGFTLSPTAPTPTAGDSTTKLATTAFVSSRGFSYQNTSIIAISANTTLTTAQLGGSAQFQLNSAVATLPVVSTTPLGATMTFLGGATGGTIKGNSTDPIINANSASQNTLYIPVGQTATVVANGASGWYVAETGKGTVSSNCQNVADYGGDNTGSRDNTAATTAAIAASATNKVCLYFGPGLWKFSSQISYTFPSSVGSFSVVGAGPDATELQFASSLNGFAVTMTGPSTSIHVRNLTLSTSSTGAGAGIVATQSPTTIANPAASALSDVTDVTFRGADGYFLTNYWSVGVALNQVSNVNLRGLNLIGSTAQLGTGIQLSSTVTAPGVQYNVTNCNFYSMQVGMSLGNYIQGVNVAQSNFTAQSNSGINVPSSMTGLDQLTIVGNQFASGIGINILSQFQNLMVANNLFIIQNVAGTYGIFNNAAVLFTYVGNTFQNANAPSLGNNPIGIYTNNTSNVGGNITGNVFRYMSPAIKLDTNAAFVNVQSNSYFNNNTNISNLGSSNTLGGGSQ